MNNKWGTAKRGTLKKEEFNEKSIDFDSSVVAGMEGKFYKIYNPQTLEWKIERHNTKQIEHEQ